jgi:hypothetical protein
MPDFDILGDAYFDVSVINIGLDVLQEKLPKVNWKVQTSDTNRR